MAGEGQAKIHPTPFPLEKPKMGQPGGGRGGLESGLSPCLPLVLGYRFGSDRRASGSPSHGDFKSPTYASPTDQQFFGGGNQRQEIATQDCNFAARQLGLAGLGNGGAGSRDSLYRQRHYALPCS